MTHLKVAVRVRPMSKRETDNGAIPVVDIENTNTISLTNVKVPKENAGDSRERIRRFVFDYCFPEDATQDSIFQVVEDVVGKSLRSRFHSCVLAYGQSCSGKTHTMVGSRDDPGLTPKLCGRIFDYFREAAVGDEVSNLKVSVSYLEIYNERVTDLLVHDTDNKKVPVPSLKVREHPKKGPYVQGLSEHQVTQPEELLDWLEVGRGKRKVAATLTNPQSSRSHSVFSVCCDGVKLHLVDLAGSERAGSRCYGVSRFREGANINKSLVALGNVISALAQQSKVERRRFIPYRDSVLTWLLKDTLGGNSNTVMIATVSPSHGCYSETVNTLRFGQRAKLIVYRPVVIEDPKEKTIRELRTEIAKLRELLRLKNLIYEESMIENTYPPIKELTLNNEEIFTQTTNINPDKNSDNYIKKILSSVNCVSENNKVIEDTENDKPVPLHSPKIVKIKENFTRDSPETKTEITTEKLVPLIDVTSVVSGEKTKKLKRTFSVADCNTKNKMDKDRSNSLTSQESLSSPKHINKPRKSIYSSTPHLVKQSSSNSLSEESVTSPGSSRSDISNKRQSTTKINSSLKTIAQKKQLGGSPRKLEKTLSTEILNGKKIEAKVDSIRKIPIGKPRSQLVAAVTSRLYTKARRKEASTNTEPTKEFPKEVTISSNAKQRLKEITRRALRAHKLRTKDTQTDFLLARRLKETSTDVQDLPTVIEEVRDAATSSTVETKEAETECHIIDSGDPRTAFVITRSCGTQSPDGKPIKPISFTKYLVKDTENSLSNPIYAGSVNINISHNYINGSQVGSVSGDSLDPQCSPEGCFPTPDLISNHNSLEQHALTPSEAITRFAETETFHEEFYAVDYQGPAEEAPLTFANCGYTPTHKNRVEKVEISNAFAPETLLQDEPTENCEPMKDFVPETARPKIVQGKDFRCDDFVILTEPRVLKSVVTTKKESFSTSDDDIVLEFPQTTKKQSKTRRKPSDKHRMFKAMSSFLEEATTLMTNLKAASTHLGSSFQVQLTMDEFPEICQKSTRNTQTEVPNSADCASQTADGFEVPFNRYDAVLEHCCARLEEKINTVPRSRVRLMSEEGEDEYNPWEVEDSSLESNPVAFSDYGSLPRKTHKRHRTPTCSPSAFLRHLTNMRRHIIENSREEFMNGGQQT